MNRSYTSSSTSVARASLRSILLITTIGCSPSSRAFISTKRVWGSGPSEASTSSSTPSTMVRVRSTSPPKSAWPGVSTMLILASPKCTEVFLARMVMPFSRSRSLESMTRSWTCSLARKVPLCHSMASTRVVLPWSTWAMMAMLRRSSRRVKVLLLRFLGFPWARCLLRPRKSPGAGKAGGARWMAARRLVRIGSRGTLHHSTPCAAPGEVPAGGRGRLGG